MRIHIADIFRDGFALASKYGGSLTPFGIVLPLDEGIPRHELDHTPYTLRYEITLLTTRDL